MQRVIGVKLLIKWNPGTSAYDETAYLVSARAQHRLVTFDSPLNSGRGIVDQMTLELRNTGGRFSPLNSSGPLYDYIKNGNLYYVPVTLQVSINADQQPPTWTTIFTGIAKIPDEAAVTTQNAPTITLDVRSMEDKLLQRRMSTSMATFVGMHDAGYNEGQIITQWLIDAGFSSTYIDHGLFQIDWAWLDDESPLEEIWALAAACGGRFYADQQGNYRYENMAHWVGLSSSETLTRDKYQKLSLSYDDKELYNVVTVEASPRQLASTGQIWAPDNLVSIPSGANIIVTAKFRQPAYSYALPTYKAFGGGGNNLTGNVNMYYVSQSAQRAVISMNNSAGETAYLRPFYIAGQAVVGGPTQEETRTSTADGNNASFFVGRGDKTRRISGNVYVQSKAQAGSLALMTLQRCEYPRLRYKMTGAPGVPSRVVGQRVTINDTTAMSSSRTAIITALSWRIDSHGYFQDIEAIDYAQLFPNVAYFVIDADRLNASTGVFY